MAESTLLPSYVELHLCRSVLKRSNFIPRNSVIGTGQRKNSYGVQKHFVQLSSCRVWELSAPIAKISRGSQRFREFSLRRCFLGTLTNPENAMPLEWVSIVDQVLLMTSLILSYLAGVVPSEKATFSNRNSIAGNNVVPANTTSSGSAAKNDQRVNSESAWDEVKTKLISALNAIEHDDNSDNRAVECEKCSPTRPLSLYAVDEGPRLRLLWATLQQLEKEVNNISEKCAIVTRNDWLEVLSEIIQSSQPICLKWLEDELHLEGRKPDKAILSVMSEKLKDDGTILQNIKKSGKEDLYGDVLLFLRFGYLRGVFSYDYKLLTEHWVDVLEDLVLTLADGVASIYLELISVDSNLSSEMNSLGFTMCSLSTRSLQRLRNEVALNQWLHQNMESIVLMYEDRFELCTLQVRFLEEHKKSETEKFYWWKKLGLRKSNPTLSPLCNVFISQLSISLKRTKELRALTGWRYYFSLFLEFSDITMPFVKAIFAKISSAISFFLVCLIGRSLGLIYTGIRQSLGWR